MALSKRTYYVRFLAPFYWGVEKGQVSFHYFGSLKEKRSNDKLNLKARVALYSQIKHKLLLLLLYE